MLKAGAVFAVCFGCKVLTVVDVFNEVTLEFECGHKVCFAADGYEGTKLEVTTEHEEQVVSTKNIRNKLN
jgi:hypothetical protein